MKQTKIDWCDRTVNPVIGCKRGCPYCYAKRLNKRFHFVKDFEKLERKESGFAIVKASNPVSIFFDSMSDFDYWTDEEILDFHKTFMASSSLVSWIGLTKSPEAISRFRKVNLLKESNFFEAPSYKGSGLWLGYTIDGKNQVDKVIATNRPLDADFISVEPLECDLFHDTNFNDIIIASDKVKLVIIGAETGNRKGKVICKKSWVNSIVTSCDCGGKLVFMKSSLKSIMGNDFRQDKLPWSVEEKQ